MSHGHTLLELALVLLIVSMTVVSVLPAAGRYRDHLATIGAREAVAGLISEARALALRSGSASVHVAADPWRAWVSDQAGQRRAVALESDFGVHVASTGGRTAVELSFDALGLGRVASQSLRFTRGGAESSLVISSFGRVRRR